VAVSDCNKKGKAVVTTSPLLSAGWMDLLSSVSHLLPVLAAGAEVQTATLLKRCACFGASFSRILIICTSEQHTNLGLL